MYDILVKKSFRYPNVSIEKFKSIKSAWIPRIGEEIDMDAFGGVVEKVVNSYNDEARIIIVLEQWTDDISCYASDLSFMIDECDAVFAYPPETHGFYDKRETLFQKAHCEFDAEEGEMREWTEIIFDEAKFDAMFNSNLLDK